jgi:glycosyltransferase involved in cell wall biosynthesis
MSGIFNMMKLSVIVPYFNEGELLLRALESIRTQRFEDNVEVVVVDDCSVEPVDRILDGNAPDRLILKVLRNSTNLGAAASRNRGVGLASGECICFLDADDVYCEDRLRLHYEFLTEFPKAGFVGSKHFLHRETVSEETPGTIQKFHPELVGTRTILPATFKESVCREYCFVTGAFTIKRELFNQLGGFREDYRWGEEWDLQVRASQVAQVGYIPIPGQRYICRPHSITTTRNPEKYISAARMFRDWDRGISGLSVAVKKELRMKARDWALLAAQVALEEQQDFRKSLQFALTANSYGLSLWGMKSIIKAMGLCAFYGKANRTPGNS